MTGKNIKTATAVNCMDGIVQEPVIDFLKKNHNVDVVDMITEPAPDKIIAEHKDTYKLNSIKQRIGISVKVHDSKVILVAGHAKCAWNLVDKEIHIAQTLNAAATIRKWFPEVMIIPVWIGEAQNVEQL